MNDIVTVVSKTAKSLILKEPFYGLLLSGLNKVYTTAIPTAAVTKQNIGFALLINPEFFLSLNEKEREGVLKHELIHIGFSHLVMFQTFRNKEVFNIAADLEVNQYIPKDHLPEDAIFLDSIEGVELPPKAGTKKYYDILMNIQKDPESDGNKSLQKLLDSDNPNNHQWQDFEDLSDAEKKLLEKQVEYQLKNVAESIKKRQGNIPGEFSEIIEKLFKQEPPKFDWKGYLRKFVSNSRVTYTKKSRRKYNKRFKGNPGIKIKFKSHILLGVDTSGSVSMSELKEFYSEIGHIHKTGHEITVAQCDTRITDISKFDPKKEWKIHGRGGTVFQPVIDEFNKGGYTTLIYFTDGEAGAPVNCPKHTLWVLSSKSKINEALPGNQIKLN